MTSLLERPLLALCCISLFAMASACGDDDGDAGADASTDAGNNASVDGSTTDGGTTTGMDGSLAAGLRIRGVALEFAANMIGSEDALADAEVCVSYDDNEDCVNSDADGNFVLEGVPNEAEVLITIDKPGYLGVARSLLTSNRDMGIGGTRVMATDDYESLYEQPGGYTTDPDKALLVFGIAPNRDGTRVELSPASGEGPFYLDENEQLDLNRNSLVLWGFQANVDPGEYTVEISHPDAECAYLPTADSGWPVDGSDTASRVMAPAGYMTWIVLFTCGESAEDAGAADGG